MAVLNFIDRKCKAIVVFIFSMIAIGLFIVSTLFAMSVCNGGQSFITGIALMVLAIPFHIFGKKSPISYLVSFAINTVASGFSVSSYYLVKDISVDLVSVVFSMVPAVAVLTLVYLMLQIFSKTKKVTVTVAVIVDLILIIMETVLWVKYDMVLFSFGFFALLIALFYLGVFGITINHEERPVLRDISFGSFGSFIILTVVVVVILSEGDLLDGADFDFGGERKKKKNNRLK